jgi:hypothetical protein
LRDSDYRNAYMKRLDKPTKHDGDNLLNFQKKPDIPLKKLTQSKLSEYLKSKTTFLWLPVSASEKKNFSENEIFHIHLKPRQNEITVKGEIT